MSKKTRCCCLGCKTKLSVLDKTITCRCTKSFCSKHRLPEDHDCEYDYKKDKIVLISVQAIKVPSM